VVGAITEGRIVQGPFDGGSFRDQYITPWLTPFAIAVGAFALVLFSYLAAVYLTLEAQDRATTDAFRRRALASAGATGVMALAVFLLAGNAPHTVPLHLATGGAAIAAAVLLWTGHFWWARVAAILQVSLIVWGWALAQSPYLIRPDLTYEMAAAPRTVLVLLLQILAAGAIIVLPSLFYLFRLFAPERRA
jgi:cytochrome bd ubiquinol oxidase subunit II